MAAAPTASPILDPSVDIILTQKFVEY